MVYELERVLRVCNGFLCSMSVTCQCCTPESDQIKFPLAMRGVGEPYAKDASLKISGQFIKHLRRRISRRMELNAFWMSSLARM